MTPSQRIIIVVKAQNEREYAEKLYNRIKTNYSDSVFLWDEEDYKRGRMKITDLDKLIFFGKAVKIDSRANDKNLRGKFNKFGMKYGWAGNICAIYASETKLSWDDFWHSFRDYCVKLNAKYSDVPVPEKNIFKEVFSSESYRCQYTALLHEFMDGGGFQAFMAKPNTGNPAFRKIAEQLLDNKEYDKMAASHVSWETLETRCGYKLQITQDKSMNCFRILNRENVVIAWGKRDLEKLGIMAFLALFEERTIEIVETSGSNRKKHEIVYTTRDSLKPIQEVVEEAQIALRDKNRTIKDSPIASILVSAIPDVLGGFMGGVGGAAVSFAALYFLGIPGLSAVGITTALKVAGALIGGGMLQGIFVLAVPIAVLAAGGCKVVMEINAKELMKDKERLLQQAIEMQQAIIVQIRAEVNAERQRADYLNSLNELLRRAITDLQKDLSA